MSGETRSVECSTSVTTTSSLAVLHPLTEAAIALLPLLLLSLFACLSVLLGFHFLCLCPRTFASSLRPRSPARKREREKKKKENGKAANPTASYSTRVYRPIMPFSDLFSSQDRSICACIPPPHPPPCTFLLSPNKRPLAAVISATGTLCNVTLPPTASSPDCRRGKCAKQRGETDRQRDACQCHQLKIRRRSLAGRDFSEAPSFTLMGLVVGGLRLGFLHKKEEI